MSEALKPLSRDQLKLFLPSHDAIRQFEKLFQVAVDLPDDLAAIVALIAASIAAITHNSLGSLQGGSALQRYHLTLAQHTGLIGLRADLLDATTGASLVGYGGSTVKAYLDTQTPQSLGLSIPVMDLKPFY